MTAQRRQAIRHRLTVGTSMSNGSMAKNVIMTIKDIHRVTAVPYSRAHRHMVNNSLTS
jgi:hypothetical protein